MLRGKIDLKSYLKGDYDIIPHCGVRKNKANSKHVLGEVKWANFNNIQTHQKSAKGGSYELFSLRAGVKIESFDGSGILTKNRFGFVRRSKK